MIIRKAHPEVFKYLYKFDNPLRKARGAKINELYKRSHEYVKVRLP